MISRASLAPWMRRPLAVIVFAAVALAALLSGGLVVAQAVDGASAPAADSPESSGGGNGDNNVAAKVNTTDGKTVYAIKLKIVQVNDETVDATNAAVAVNSGCNDCSTVAIAFEGVVVVGEPSNFSPTNLALAMNVDCSGCTAFAHAYQQVVQTSTRVRITREGRQEIARIRKDLKDLKHSDLTLEQIRARVAADEQAFAAVLLNEMVPVGNSKEEPPADAQDISDSPEASPGPAEPTSAGSADPASPTSTPAAGSTTPSAEPAPSSPDASPSASASASP